MYRVLFPRLQARAVRTILTALAALSFATGAGGNSDVTVKGGLNKGGKYVGTNPKVFTPTKPVSVAAVGPIKTHLNAGRSVTITTASSQTGNGDLSVTVEVAKTGKRPDTLALQAERDLLINKPIRATKSPLSVELKAGRKITLNAPITTFGGNIVVHTQEPFELSGTLSAGNGQIQIQNGSVQSTEPQTLGGFLVDVAPGGALRLNGNVEGNVSVAGTVSPGAQGTSNLQIAGTVTMQPTGAMAVNLGGVAKFGKITSTGAVTLGGSLRVDCVDGFEDLIVSSNSFTVLTAPSITGTFDGVPDGGRVALADELGTLKVTYTATSVTLSDWQPVIIDLTWDPGSEDAGTQVYTNARLRGKRHYFRVHTEVTDIGAWRTRLTTAPDGEADVYMRRGLLPSTTANEYRSNRVGSDGFVLNKDQFAAAQEWFLLVQADPAKPWSLVSGRAYVQDLGILPWLDTDNNGLYQIGEAPIAHGSGPTTIYGEGMRFFRVTAPSGTPALSLWLNGSSKSIAMKRAAVPFHTATNLYDRKQNGQLLVVPPVVISDVSNYFLSVVGSPGEEVNLDAQIQEVTDVAFNSLVPNVEVPGAPYRVYRVQVPAEQIAWDVSVVPVQGNPNVAIRRAFVPAEFDNDAFSEVPGQVRDSITVVPNFLTDGAWYITVYGDSPYEFTLRNGPPVITPIGFTDEKLNDQPERAGWRFFALTDIQAQLGAYGWMLELANFVPGTEIALRRNAVPSRWRQRKDGFTNIIESSVVEYSSKRGFLERPAHQPDVWYAGVYMPTEPLGEFTLITRSIGAPLIGFDGGTHSVANLEAGRWAFVRVNVPAGVLGWDVRVRNVTGAVPAMAVRHDLLPEIIAPSALGNLPSSWSPSKSPNWPTGNQWLGTLDWTGFALEPGGTGAGPGIVAAMGRPLEPGSYYVGVLNTSLTTASSFTIESRGIGQGQTFEIANLAYNGGSSEILNLPPREARYFKATIGPNTPSWEVLVEATVGEVQLMVRRDYIPDFHASPGHTIYRVEDAEQTEIRKVGHERYVVLPRPGQDFLDVGDYYFAVVGEGVLPTTTVIGSDTSNAVMQSAGALAITQLGAASSAGINHPVTLVAGQIQAFQFDVPPDTQALELRLLSALGSPVMTVYDSSTLPCPELPSEHGVYGLDGGLKSRSSTFLITAPNPETGKWSILVNAPPGNDASAILNIISHGPMPLTFDNGVIAVTEHQPGTWRYFTVQVPPSAVGWDLRLRDVIGINPSLMVNRDFMPALSNNAPAFYPPGWQPHTVTEWPSGNQWLATTKDWTGYLSNPGGLTVPDRIVMGMGRPLEPGTYNAGVYNNTGAPVSYTIDSRGIGDGFTYPVTDLAYVGGTVQVTGLSSREARYFRVVVPPNSPSWEVLLTPNVGEAELLARYTAIPDFYAQQDGSIHLPVYGREVEMKKVGPERYVLLPDAGQTALPEGVYYLAVVSEGVNGTSSVIGLGEIEAQLTSVGPLAIKHLGTPTAEGTREDVNLEAGQILAYQITVPPSTRSLEVRLDTPVGNPQISLVQGDKLPIPGQFGPNPKYGWNSGLHGATHNSIITIADPAEGTWSILVRGGQAPQSQTFGPSSAQLVVTALSAEALAFNDGNITVASQQAGSWRYFVVNVPADALGWDVRLRNLTGAVPALLVRRDELPFVAPGTSPSNQPSWTPSASTSWPTLHQWLGSVDWTGYLNKLGDLAGPPGLVAAMGRPLEPGTYYVGVYNNRTTSTSYTITSRGIGSGLAYEVTDLGFANGSSPITELPARDARYFKVTIPAATPSWELSIGPTVGDLQLAIRRDHIPDFAAPLGGTVYAGVPQLKMRKAGAERYLLLPQSDTIPAGDYYIAVVSDGVNPNPPLNIVGTAGPSSGNITSHGTLAVTDLGSATVAGVSQNVNLLGTQTKAFHFDVPAGTESLELRLENTIGFPKMMIGADARLPGPPAISGYASVNGGVSGTPATRIHTVINPKSGPWTVMVRATEAGPSEPNLHPDASTTLVVRQKPSIPLNFDAAQNGNGLSNTDTRQAIDSEHHIFKITPPSMLGGQPVLGWIIRAEASQGSVTVKVFKDLANVNTGIDRPAGTTVVVPPFLTFDQPWYVLVRATGATTYQITSRAVTLERPVWVMPESHNVTFGDSGNDALGNPLPGDRGVDLEQGSWHFFAVDVPANNRGLLRTELQAISGNPDLYIREDGVPTTDHNSAGAGGTSLIHRTLAGATTTYGNWVPLNGRFEKRLRPGRWFLGVRAGSTSNVRYRLVVSSGNVRELALDPSTATVEIPHEVTGQVLPDNDWRYYRFTVPENAPDNWTLNFSQTVGDVVMRVRDTVPPGQMKLNTTAPTELAHIASDNKNQGPYVAAYDLPGSYTLTTPPLRPGHVYYVGFRSNNSATFSFNSHASSTTVGTPPTLDFYTGSVNTSIPANSSLTYRILVPAEGTRFKYTSTHTTAVVVRIEQGAPTSTSGSQHYASNNPVPTANSFKSQALSSTSWPWQAGETYYVRFVNTSAAPENIVFTLNGKNAQIEDEDGDLLLDAWEMQFFSNLGQTGSGDPDADGVTNATEFADGTAPNNANSAKYVLNLLAKNGTAAANPAQPKYDKGTVVSVSSTPTPDYEFLCWIGGPFQTDNYAIKATGTVTLPVGGPWTFGVHSGDGVRLLVNGATLINDNTTHAPAAAFAQITLPAGSYPIELVAFERLGGEGLELFAAPGSFTSIQPEFRLVGDTANGGLAVQTVVDGSPTPGFLVRQVALVGGIVNSLAIADSTLSGTGTNRLEMTGVIEAINFLDYSAYEGYFTDNAHFPLTTEMEDESFDLTIQRQYTLTALHSLPIGVGTDAESLTWHMGGEAPWLAESDPTANDGVDLAGSGPIGDSQSSILQTTIQGPGTLTFRWRVSSQSGDNLTFSLNGASPITISGEQPWALRTINVPAGTHRAIWTYSKNTSGSAGNDRGYIDQVTFTP